MKWFGIIAMILLMTMSGCKKEMGILYRGCFENDDAVSLKDIIKIYDKYASAKEDSTDFDLFAAFYGQDAADNVLEYEIAGCLVGSEICIRDRISMISCAKSRAMTTIRQY